MPTRLKRVCESAVDLLPVKLCGIGILPMLHGLEAHATKNRFSHAFLRPSALRMGLGAPNA
jgi:hypothetical protein